jgi:MFS family permease
VTRNAGRTQLANQTATSPDMRSIYRPTGSMSHAWRALRHRNFKLFVGGQSISVIGTWMTRLATTWLVYHLTHSALLLGIVSFSGQIVSFALGPFAGVWVERLNRRKLLMWTQAFAAIQSLALAALTLAHVITLGEIIALTALQGLINAFDMPARQSFLVQMVEEGKPCL